MTQKCEEVQTFAVAGVRGGYSPLQFKVYTGSERVEVWRDDEKITTLWDSAVADLVTAVVAASRAATEERVHEVETRLREELSGK